MTDAPPPHGSPVANGRAKGAAEFHACADGLSVTLVTVAGESAKGRHLINHAGPFGLSIPARVCQVAGNGVERLDSSRVHPPIRNEEIE
jgi:hypothetical protein